MADDTLIAFGKAQEAISAILAFDGLPPDRPRNIQAAADGRTYVYFIAGTDTPVKIGLSKSPHERLSILQTAHWTKLTILALVEGSYALEREFHIRFAATRLEGEWFERSAELDALIASIQAEHGIPEPYVPAISMKNRGRLPARLNQMEQAA